MAVNQGYFLIALGKQYIDECVKLVETIRKQGDARPVALLIHPEDGLYASEKNMFQDFVQFLPNDDLWKANETGFEKYCLYPRINFEKYLPYEENIIVDSDVLCQYNPDELWNYLSNQSLPIRMLGRKNDPNWHWGSIGEVSNAYGKNVPHVHGGFFYLRKNSFLEQFFDYCKDVFYRYDEFKCKRAFRGGRVDEIIFAISHANFNMDPVEFDDVPAMTFNYTPDISIPSKLQTEGGQNVELKDYIPFVHMFDKMGGTNFENLYNKIMNGV
jgi:hypothetical protein